jgi:hypothetical protein
MNLTESFFSYLAEWCNEAQPVVMNFESLLNNLNITIGGGSIDFKNISLECLKKRVEYLIKEESFDEDFLIIGLVGRVTEALESNVTEHGDRILFFEEKLKQDPDHEEAKLQLFRLKQPVYLEIALYELNSWNLVVSSYFNKGIRRKLNRDKLINLPVTGQLN